ncbi:MAG: acylneuraminate cytidylyltransferase family protein [Devosia sp.]|uniref:acylneuraminate cytidylyltransferase family protein n=1 Tax=Devosia sp. TaxID=1871048 RepID=UPI0024CD1194|nr:acylneuraminate cytidylyltransferase family protein [Devosia sp.]UYO00448.1 MAG: acylneuraminate cytidylyltransferase family protein [Devosia sp.]
MKIAAFVPIKLNSQRLPSKNILDLGGHPMCSYILNTLLASRGIDSVSVFCSSPAILKYVPDGVGLELRDAALDRDEVKGLQLFQGFANAVEADYYLLGHATAPFISVETVEKVIAAVREGRHDSAFTAQKVQTYAWYDSRPINYSPTDMARTQDTKPILIESSGIYLYSRDLILNGHRRIGDNPGIIELGYPECIDVDTLEDFRLAEKYVEQLPFPYDRNTEQGLPIHAGYR